MSFRRDLITYLSTVTGITDLVGARISYEQSPQSDAEPRIVITQVSGDPKHHMTAATGKVLATFQFDCIGTELTADTVAEALREGMDGYRGAMGDSFVSLCHRVEERGDVYAVPDGSDAPLHVISQDYLIGYSESVPSF